MRVAHLFGVVALAACGGTPVERPAPRVPAPDVMQAQTYSAQVPRAALAATATSLPRPLEVPTDCARSAEDSRERSRCLLPADFVKVLCDSPARADVSLALFAKTTPFTRLYLRGKLDELAFDEEVLDLGPSPRSSTGISVLGEHRDVLRWDGTCSRGVEAEMLTQKRPPRPRAARLPWSHLTEPLQISLIVSSDKIKAANAKQGRECMGATYSVTPECGKAQSALSDAIVAYVRSDSFVWPRTLQLATR
jgi:hypothetical protein